MLEWQEQTLNAMQEGSVNILCTALFIEAPLGGGEGGGVHCKMSSSLNAKIPSILNSAILSRQCLPAASPSTASLSLPPNLSSPAQVPRWNLIMQMPPLNRTSG